MAAGLLEDWPADSVEVVTVVGPVEKFGLLVIREPLLDGFSDGRDDIPFPRERMIEIVTAQAGVPVRGENFKEALRQFQD
jgi:hypothetical protein